MTQKKAAEAKIDLARCYRAIFLDGEGMPSPEGESVLRDLEKVCGWMVDRMPLDNAGAVDPLKLAGAYEKRRVYKHIREMLFLDLTKLKRVTEK